jgi:hypothetical protein
MELGVFIFSRRPECCRKSALITALNLSFVFSPRLVGRSQDTSAHTATATCRKCQRLGQAARAPRVASLSALLSATVVSYVLDCDAE